MHDASSHLYLSQSMAIFLHLQTLQKRCTCLKQHAGPNQLWQTHRLDVCCFEKIFAVRSSTASVFTAERCLQLAKQ